MNVSRNQKYASKNSIRLAWSSVAKFLFVLLALGMCSTIPMATQASDYSDSQHLAQLDIDRLTMPDELGAGSATSLPSVANQPVARSIERIDIRGNRRVEAETIRAQLLTQVGQPLNRQLISQDIRRIYALGYFDDVVVQTIQSDDNKTILVYEVVEKPAITEIRLRGNSEVGEDDIREVIDLRQYAILDISKVQQNVQKIRDLYTDKGFFLAEVDYAIEHPDGRTDLAVVVFNIYEYAKVEVKNITFLGNASIASDELKNIMATREGHWMSFLTSFGSFRESDFETDLQRLTAYYYDHGFVQVAVSMPSIRLSKDKRFLYITIRIDEGEQFQTGSVDVQGDLLNDREEFLELIRLETGETFSYGTMRQDMEALRDIYHDVGYAYANINPLTRVNPTTNTVDVTYDIQQGELVYIGRIEVVGNNKTRDQVIRRELVIEEGDLYSGGAMRTSQARIERLGYFESVNVTSQRGPADNIIDLRVEVAERMTGTFQIGAGFSTDENFIFNAQVSQNNLFGRGQSLSFQVQASSLRTLFQLQFMEPWLYGTPWQFSVDLYNYDFAYQDFSRRSVGGNLTIGYPITDKINLALTYKLEEVSMTPGGTSGQIQQPTLNLFSDGLTSSLRLSAFYDTRNNRLFPTKGAYHLARVEAADNDWTLSQNQFIKYDAETRWYFPLFWEFVLKLNGSLGYVVSTSSDRPVPLFERYFAGGPTTVRGFDRFRLGPVRHVPRDSSDPVTGLQEFHIGGNKRLVLTAEVEFPIFAAANINGVLFADAGNAFDDDQPLTLMLDLFQDETNMYMNALRTSVGFGVRWFSPIGPLRFEWGIPLRRLPQERPIVFDFSISNAF